MDLTNSSIRSAYWEFMHESCENEIIAGRMIARRGQEARTIIKNVDRTSLPTGKIELERMLSNPTTDIQELKTRLGL